jgi:oligopeptide transport system substrate-binding protein
VDETYTMRFFFHTNLSTLKKLDQGNNQNSVVLSNTDFRKAMSLALDREEWVTATEGYKPAYSMINSLYFYDVYEDPASIYRNTREAMAAICNVYGVTWGEGTPYKTLEEAYKSINGFNITEAKALFAKACQQLVADGLYKEGEDIVIEIAYAAGAMDSSQQQQIVLFNQQLNKALSGTGFGKIELKAVDNLANRYKAVAQGQYAMGYGAWGGAAFYPFTLFQVYCDPDYADPIHEIGCWDPTQEELTLTVEGEKVTMTWQEWSGAMAGTGKFANASNEVKLQILADIEENYLEKYYVIPLASTTACSMLSYKVSYYTDSYNIMYGFGGMRLMRHNYTDGQWADFVASQGGQLTY